MLYKEDALKGTALTILKSFMLMPAPDGADIGVLVGGGYSDAIPGDIVCVIAPPKKHNRVVTVELLVNDQVYHAFWTDAHRNTKLLNVGTALPRNPTAYYIKNLKTGLLYVTSSTYPDPTDIVVHENGHEVRYTKQRGKAKRFKTLKQAKRRFVDMTSSNHHDPINSIPKDWGFVEWNGKKFTVVK